MRTFQVSFGGGEIAQEMFGRLDLRHFQTGLASVVNFIILPHGPAQNRAGTEHIGECKNGGAKKVRLMPFVFNTDQAYCLQLGDQYLRIVLEGGQVVEAAVTISGATQADPVVITATAHGYSDGDEVWIEDVGGMTELNGRFFKVANKATNTFEITDLLGNNIDGTGFGAYTSGGTAKRVYEIATPWLEADLFDLQFEQDGNTLTVVHPSYNPRILTRVGATNWTITEAGYDPVIAAPATVIADQNGVGTGTTKFNYMVTAVSLDTDEESLASKGPAITAISKANPAQVTSAGHGFTTGDLTFLDGIVGMEELNGRFFTVTKVDDDNYTLDGEDSTGYTTYVSGGNASKACVTNNLTTAGNHNVVEWDAVSGAGKYNIYKYSEGILGYIGETDSLTFDDFNIEQDALRRPPQADDPWTGADNRPGAVALHAERKVYAGSNNFPRRVGFSRPGTDNNFSVQFPPRDDNPIIRGVRLPDSGTIRHLISSEDLIVLASSAVGRIFQAGGNALTYRTLGHKVQAKVGSSKITPILVGDVMLFVADLSFRIHDMRFFNEAAKYIPRDITVVNPAIIDGRELVQWDYARVPNHIAWAVADDGKVVAVTYLPGQEPEIIAFHRHETKNGDFESVAVVPESTNEHSVYFVVRRKIGGVERRFIERLHKRDFAQVQDAFFVDAGLTLDDPKTITGITAAEPPVVSSTAHGFSDGDIVQVEDVEGMTEVNRLRFTVKNPAANTYELYDTDGTPVAIDGTGFTAYESGGVARKEVSEVGGLHHLEGQTVSVLADGNWVDDKVVSAGKIQFAPGPDAARAHVGLPITARIQTLPVVLQREGFGVGDKKQVTDLYFKFSQTRGLKAGPTLDNLVPWTRRSSETSWLEPTGAFSGETKLNIASDWSDTGQVWIEQAAPLPATINAMAMEVQG